jgi:hypothetical protein
MSKKLCKIREPIWNGGHLKVGIGEYWFANRDILPIRITWKNSQGIKHFPGKYSITKEKAFTYPVQVIKDIRLRIIPITDLDIETRCSKTSCP